MFPTTTYTHRRSQLLQKLDTGLILLMGNRESPMNYTDNTFPFRQDSSFLYFCGLDSPDLAAVLDVETGITTLYGDELSLDMIIWTGLQPLLTEKCEQVGIADIRGRDELSDRIREAKSTGRQLHLLPPYRHDNIIELAEMLGVAPSAIKDHVSLDLIKAVVDIRSIKTDEEIVELDFASDLSADMHIKAMKMLRPGMTEAQVAAAVRAVALSAGTDLSYPIIFTNHGEILHDHSYSNTLHSGQLALCDAGGESALHYAGDLTRTYPVDPRFTSKQKDIYQIVLDAQIGAIEALKPGVLFKDVHMLSAKIIATGLKELGLMKGDIDEALAAGAHALFFPHGLGHMMGLDVHDMEDLGEEYVGYTPSLPKSTQFGLKSLRLGRALESGFVVTIEPGIYFIPTLIDRWRSEGKFMEFIQYDKVETYKDFGGIRIEEDYLITDTASRMLGKGAPKTIAEIEEIRAL